MNIKMIAVASTLIVATFGAGPAAHAAASSKTLFLDPSVACQLSIPTTNTAVRPKATGYRNEGANAFVICGTANVIEGSQTDLYFQLYAFDGLSHNVSCTAVNRFTDGTPSPATYVTKSVTVAPYGSIDWNSTDLFINNLYATSITCNLPSGVSITGIRSTFPVEIGS